MVFQVFFSCSSRLHLAFYNEGEYRAPWRIGSLPKGVADPLAIL